MSRRKNTELRKQILQTAGQIMLQKSYKGMSMDDLANSLSMKKANLFHYFESKEALALAVVDNVAICMQNEIADTLSNRTCDPILTVMKMFDRNAEKMMSSHCCGGCLLGNLAQELSDQSECIRAKVKQYLQFWSQSIAALLKHYEDQGYFTEELVPAEAAESILYLLEGATLFCKAQKNTDAYEHSKKMTKRYLESYKR